MNFRFIALFLALGITSIAAPIPATCNSANTLCYIPDNVQVQLPYIATAGDTVVLNSSNMVVDVFRIFNNFVNTGLGTGLGNLAFLYSAIDGDLPAPATYSANVVTILAATSNGFTTVTSGTHSYVLAAPEPATLTLSALGALLLLLRIFNRAQNSKEEHHA